MVIWSADPCMLVYPSPGRRKHIIIIRLINKRGLDERSRSLNFIVEWGRGRTRTRTPESAQLICLDSPSSSLLRVQRSRSLYIDLMQLCTQSGETAASRRKSHRKGRGRRHITEGGRPRMVASLARGSTPCIMQMKNRPPAPARPRPRRTASLGQV